MLTYADQEQHRFGKCGTGRITVILKRTPESAQFHSTRTRPFLFSTYSFTATVFQRPVPCS